MKLLTTIIAHLIRDNATKRKEFLFVAHYGSPCLARGPIIRPTSGSLGKRDHWSPYGPTCYARRSLEETVGRNNCAIADALVVLVEAICTNAQKLTFTTYVLVKEAKY
ncbi:hypothetical protein CR513_04919, partial [Mucuna pruriens]